VEGGAPGAGGDERRTNICVHATHGARRAGWLYRFTFLPPSLDLDLAALVDWSNCPRRLEVATKSLRGLSEVRQHVNTSPDKGDGESIAGGRVFLRIAHTFDAAAIFAAPFLASLSRSSVDLPVGAISDGERARSARGQSGRGLWGACARGRA